MNGNSKSNSFIIKVAAVLVLIWLIPHVLNSCASAPSEQWYKDHKEAIDDYNERHKDDWNGYKGNRRNSWGESDALRIDGYDPEEYRKAHGY